MLHPTEYTFARLEIGAYQPIPEHSVPRVGARPAAVQDPARRPHRIQCRGNRCDCTTCKSIWPAKAFTSGMAARGTTQSDGGSLVVQRVADAARPAIDCKAFAGREGHNLGVT